MNVFTLINDDDDNEDAFNYGKDFFVVSIKDLMLEGGIPLSTTLPNFDGLINWPGDHIWIVPMEIYGGAKMVVSF